MKKLLALLLCLVMAVSLLACGNKTTDTTTGDKTEQTGGETTNNDTEDTTGGDEAETSTALTELPMPLTEEKQELSVWTFWGNNDFLDSPNETAGAQKMEEITNVHIDYQYVTSSEASEKYGLMMASGDVADIVYFALATSTQTYPGGYEKGIEDGVFLDVTDLIKNYMPNYSRLLEEYPEAKMGVTTDNGVLTLYSFSAEDEGLAGENDWAGLVIRQDWLEDLNLEMPVTLDDWHTVLTAFKNEKGADAPLMIGSSGTVFSDSFLAPFGIYQTWYQVDGEVRFGAAQPEYKEYLELMAQWYSEGLIDPNFMANNANLATDTSYLTTGRTGAFVTFYSFAMDGLPNMGFPCEEGFYAAPIQNPVKNVGDKSITKKVGDTIVNSQIGISTNCENPELAAMWLDFQYTTEGMLLNMYGVEGVSYTIGDDGSYQFTDVIMNNPDGYTPTDAMKFYARGNGLGMYNWETAMRTYSNYDAIVDCEAVWTNQDISMYIPKQITMTEAEGTEYGTLYTAVSTMVNEYSGNVITGNASLDDFDQFVEDLYNYGLTRCIEIQQAALDRYYNRANLME